MVGVDLSIGWWSLHRTDGSVWDADFSLRPRLASLDNVAFACRQSSWRPNRRRWVSGKRVGGNDRSTVRDSCTVDRHPRRDEPEGGVTVNVASCSDAWRTHFTVEIGHIREFMACGPESRRSGNEPLPIAPRA